MVFSGMSGQHVDGLQSNQASFKINLVILYLSSCFMVCKILHCTGYVYFLRDNLFPEIS